MKIDFGRYGREVRSIRKALKMTQKQVYQRTGISIETMRRIEGGIQEPKISTLEKLSNLYKYDLIHLLTTCRSKTNFFSDDIVKSINQDLKTYNYDSLKKTIASLIQHSIEELDDKVHVTAKKYLVNYLDAFNKIEFANSRDLKKSIINVENLLIFFNNNNGGIGEDAYLYELEVSSIIYLSILYRHNDLFDKAIALTNKTLDRLHAYTCHTKRQTSHINALYINLAYVYHRIDEHQMVIDTVNKALSDTSQTFSNYLYHELITRKAIAYYFLNDDRYEPLLTSILLNSNQKQKTVVCNVFAKSYNIHHPLCQFPDGDGS